MTCLCHGDSGFAIGEVLVSPLRFERVLARVGICVRLLRIARRA